MPTKPKRPCSFPGCPLLTHERYCEAHTKVMNQRYNRNERDPDTAKRYGQTWRLIRNAYAKHHPLCEECLREGRIVPVSQVHHIVPLREGGSSEWDNLISLCNACHARIHAKRGDRWGKH